MQYQSDFLSIIESRGFIHQGTDLKALDVELKKNPITAYIGFDCTAESLHVGSLVSIMLLRWLQKTGHTPIVVMGGGTTKIGDPSGKDEARAMLTPEKIHQNMMGIEAGFRRFLDFDGKTNAAFMVNNADWLESLKYIDMLRDVGRHFSVNRMLTMDSVKMRLEREQNLSFLEFNYMILQSYDFVELHNRYDCRLQMGGSDQWGNIVSGVELGRRMGCKELFGVTTPLITTSSGAKMGKTAAGAVWLNESHLPSYDYWQFWRNTGDADVGKFLRLFTDLPLEEIARLEKLQGAELNEAKKILANEATKLCRGEEAAIAAANTAQQVFEQGGAGDDLPVLKINKDDIGKILIADLIKDLGFATSKSEARRLIAGGGVKVNDIAVQDEVMVLSGEQLKDANAKISVGKKKHGLVQAQ